MSPIEQIHEAVRSGNAPLLRQAFLANPHLKPGINDPIGPFDSPLILSAKTPALLDAMLEAGADINARSRWWAGGFGLLDTASDELAAYAIERGAIVNAHAAARLGHIDRLLELVAANPALVHARGPDGKTPLHCARTVEIARLLLDKGAEIDAPDVDHESTPLQHLVTERPEVAQYLLSRGAKADLLAAAALGDLSLVRQHLDNDPTSIRMRVDPEWFPMRNPHAGGTIYRWTLGFQASAHELAARHGHKEILALLWDRSPADLKLACACWLKDPDRVAGLLAVDPDLSQRLLASDQSLIAHAATNNDLAAIKLMLQARWPVDAPGQHGGTALHWSAWHGNAAAVSELIKGAAPLEDDENEFRGTPLAWAIHGSENGWQRDEGDYPATVRTLLSAGAKIPDRKDGTPEVRALLDI